MKYADTRSKIRSGDVLFWSHKPMRSWYDLQIQLIRFFTRSEWSHTAVAWVIGERVFVLEAVSQGVRIYPLSQTEDFMWVSRGIFSDTQEKFALAHVGEPYSKWDAIRSFFGASNDKDSQWFCSEYVCSVLGLPVHNQTPAETMRYLLEDEELTALFIKTTSLD